MTLGTAMPHPADTGLNLDTKDCYILSPFI